MVEFGLFGDFDVFFVLIGFELFVSLDVLLSCFEAFHFFLVQNIVCVYCFKASPISFTDLYLFRLLLLFPLKLLLLSFMVLFSAFLQRVSQKISWWGLGSQGIGISFGFHFFGIFFLSVFTLNVLLLVLFKGILVILVGKVCVLLVEVLGLYIYDGLVELVLRSILFWTF